MLSGGAALDDCIRQTSLTNLHFLPAGPAPAFPPELLASPAMAEMLEMVRGRYDSILLDSTPIVDLSDGAQLAALADGAIVVVSAAKTEQARLLDALRILEEVGVPVLGIVYNRSIGTPALEWLEQEDTRALEYHE